MGRQWKQWQTFIFLGSKITADGDCSHEIKRRWLLGRQAMTNLESILKSRVTTLPAKVHLVKAMVFSSSHGWMWEWNHKEGWMLKNWCFWTVVLEKALESPLDCRIKLVTPKGNQSWIFIGGTDAEAETPILWPPGVKNWLIEKTLMLLKIEGRRIRDDRGWDGWMPSLTRWTWVWASSGSWWWTGKPGILQSMMSQRVGHDWATELNWWFHISCRIVFYISVGNAFGILIGFYRIYR